MFNELDLFLNGFGAEPKQVEQFGQSFMAHLDVVSHRASFGGQAEPAILLVIDKPASGQPANHVGNGGSAETKRGGNIRDPGISLLIDQFLNALEVILGGLRTTGSGSVGWAALRLHGG